MAKAPADKNGSLGFEDKLWLAADVLRNNMDPAEYKHVVLGLLFLKYINDAFAERRAHDADPPVAARGELHARALRERDGEHEAAAVVGVLADQVDAAGGLRGDGGHARRQ
jgi:hypothetical protein